MVTFPATLVAIFLDTLAPHVIFTEAIIITFQATLVAILLDTLAPHQSNQIPAEDDVNVSSIHYYVIGAIRYYVFQSCR